MEMFLYRFNPNVEISKLTLLRQNVGNLDDASNSNRGSRSNRS